MKIRLCLLLTLLAVSAQVSAEQAVYSSVGAHGEVRFSDQPSDDAAVLYVFAPEASAAEAQRIRQQTSEQLDLADELEQARLEREAAYADNRATVIRSIAQTRPQPGFGSEYRRDYGYRTFFPGFQHRLYGPEQNPPPAVGPVPPRRPFAPAFKPVAPALQN